jgi:hypothetical protein
MRLKQWGDCSVFAYTPGKNRKLAPSGLTSRTDVIGRRRYAEEDAAAGSIHKKYGGFSDAIEIAVDLEYLRQYG